MKKFLTMLVMAAILMTGTIGCSSTPTTAKPKDEKPKDAPAPVKDAKPAGM